MCGGGGGGGSGTQKCVNQEWPEESLSFCAFHRYCRLGGGGPKGGVGATPRPKKHCNEAWGWAAGGGGVTSSRMTGVLPV